MQYMYVVSSHTNSNAANIPNASLISTVTLSFYVVHAVLAHPSCSFVVQSATPFVNNSHQCITSAALSDLLSQIDEFLLHNIIKKFSFPTLTVNLICDGFSIQMFLFSCSACCVSTCPDFAKFEYSYYTAAARALLSPSPLYTTDNQSQPTPFCISILDKLVNMVYQ
ncbi:unnamed protein product [Vicia faba]|uniref:Uncharacterized protein n=1 Tax=Vicia faba TaxID=3906 RepID=A0AAV1B8A0_VICFA|nr:unnamed protein product [Vicia faba]